MGVTARRFMYFPQKKYFVHGFLKQVLAQVLNTVTGIAMNGSATYFSHIALEFDVLSGWRVAAITLSRPDTQNFIDAAMAEEIREACATIHEDDRCRLVILTGSGSGPDNCFSRGRSTLLDSEFPASEQIERLKTADALAALEIPVLVAVNGAATGHGLELALAGDIRIASEDAHFALWESGQSPIGWDGGTQRLPRLVGPAWALDMALTGRRLDSAEALQIGLVNRVVPGHELESATWQLAEAILASAPIAARFAKEAVRKGMDLTLEQGLRLEADLSIILQSTEDRKEGIASFLQRRQPGFAGS